LLPTRSDSSYLQHPSIEQSEFQAGKFAYLVQKDRASIRGLRKTTQPPLGGTGEAAPFRGQKTILKQSSDAGMAAQFTAMNARCERFDRLWNRARNHFFSRARLTKNKHGRICRCYPLFNLRQHPTQRTR